jgi:hypothetical protein
VPLIAAFSLVLCACAGGYAARPASGPPPDRHIAVRDLTRFQDLSLHQVVERLYPTALNSRRVSLPRPTAERGPHVYINGSFAGDVSLLREIPVSSVFEVRLLSPMQLGFWYSRQNPHGAIDVILRR